MDEIGAGAWGKVRKVKRIEDGELMAVKIMYTSRIQRKIKNGIERLKAEYEIVKKLSHPFVIKYSCLDMESKPNYKIYLFMELCPNATHPSEYIRNNWERLLSFTRKVIEVLHYLHVQKGIAHHDIKPQNIVVDACTGDIKLIDFALASEDVANSSCFWGTPSYQSPEQLSSTTKTFDGSKSDIWSFGIMLWELLSFTLPYKPTTTTTTSLKDIDTLSNQHPEAQVFSVMKRISNDPVPPLVSEMIKSNFGNPTNTSLMIDLVMDSLLIKDPSKRIDCANLYLWSLANLS